MNEDIELMMKMYNTYEVDWMGDIITSLSSLTRHHIVKKENGGINDISNYALLTENSHHLLHFLEENYYEDYISLNRLFLELNRGLCPPDVKYYEKVRKIVKKVKKSIKNSRRIRNKKNKSL